MLRYTTCPIDPRVGSGRVKIFVNYGGLGRVWSGWVENSIHCCVYLRVAFGIKIKRVLFCCSLCIGYSRASHVYKT